ncbi:F0F1 ATP synthase subunit gamma [Hoyosella rhizosphaerae]|uniref:ATP synthase gamma chain n=1 Tax=Hoyosella rhizosphaerae TaxID=1755582 RepID=A0A916UGM0_9ACTN|nr:F0F1 ATP synthase subunit gamma [Hoyosella rhizosphaerae]MBN4927832.1 F0F1 ATP synthase subunit gamma [Hoyosella rhizosphaerae]GGC70322.1 ATP synthase gamma chain [Hoyosella rhizosphaerae]
MGSLRELRSRIKSVNSTKKITKAQEMIATSRIAKAQARVAAHTPYAEEITKVLSELASGSQSLDHPLLSERADSSRAAVLIVTSDRGMCGGYNSNVLKEAEELLQLLRQQGKTPVVYVLGNKGLIYYTFRGRDIAASWTGFSQAPGYVDAARASDHLVEAFMAGSGKMVANPSGEGEIEGVDELHIVYTKFVSMLSQRPVVRRMAPLEVEIEDENVELGEDMLSDKGEPQPLWNFEPDADTLLSEILPKYISTRIYAALLESAASESAARRTAMKSATDNATELANSLTRQMNQARQAMITQEISEIVGGANALAATAGSD